MRTLKLGSPLDNVPDSHEYEEPETFDWDVWAVVSKDRYKTGLRVSARTKSEAENKARVGIERIQELSDVNSLGYVEFDVMVRKVSPA